MPHLAYRDLIAVNILNSIVVNSFQNIVSSKKPTYLEQIIVDTDIDVSVALPLSLKKYCYLIKFYVIEMPIKKIGSLRSLIGQKF